jgi:hypothetical protein
VSEQPSAGGSDDAEGGAAKGWQASEGRGPAETGAGTPRWVKVLAVVAVVVLVLIVVMLLTGHGPGSHMQGALAERT